MAGPASYELSAYRTLTRLARPAAGLILRMRLRRGKEDAARLGERLGQPGVARPGGSLVWLHAASVGEANSVLPLIMALAERRPATTLLLTTGTVTSARSIAPRLPKQAVHQFVPLDAPQLVGRFLQHWRPALAVFTEQEIWPNLVVETARRGVPLAIVNARVSEASYERWQRRSAMASALFGCFSVVLAQSEVYADRYRSLGAKSSINVGNLKIDAPPPPVNDAEKMRLVTALAGRPHLLAASTHEGEETLIAAAHRETARRLPGFMTIIVPRHPERGPRLVEQFRSEGFSVKARSLGEVPGAATDVYIADTIGELGTLYAMSPVSFIGGSLIEHGGQNPIEAVRHSSAVLTGPSTANFEDTFAALRARGGAVTVRSAADLASATLALLTAPEARARQQRGADAALAELGGALERTLAALLPLLPVESEVARAG